MFSRCVLQMGGSDQWGNMVNGVDLGRRVEKAELFALTAPLITTSEGKKMGKSASGAVWLNADKLSPYDYWQVGTRTVPLSYTANECTTYVSRDKVRFSVQRSQFWRNTDDADVGRFLKLFTELSMDEIEQLEQLKGSAINEAKASTIH